MKILWLCSWYPHPANPFEGDFIQRHARAVAPFGTLTVLYVCQDGIQHENKKDEIIVNKKDGFEEQVVIFRYRKTGMSLRDRIVYNLAYQRTCRRLIYEYMKHHGKPDVVHVHIPLKAGLIARWIRSRWKIPYFLSEHSSHYDSRSPDYFFGKSRWYQKRVARIFKEAAAVFSVSRTTGNLLQAAFDLPDIRVIRNTVDTSLFYYKKQITVGFRFIHVSTLLPIQKNVIGMLRAFAALRRERRDCEFVVIGPAGQTLLKEIQEAGLADGVHFTGEIPYPAVADQMQQASAFVMFSRFENFPCAVIEALCCGLPVISSDTGGISEAINDTNGILVENENEEELRQAMCTMIDRYQVYDRADIAKSAVDLYSFSTIGKQIVDNYLQPVKS